MLLWDTRSAGGGPVLRVADAHGKQDVHCVDWSELREHFLVTGRALGALSFPFEQQECLLLPVFCGGAAGGRQRLLRHCQAVGSAAAGVLSLLSLRPQLLRLVPGNVKIAGAADGTGKVWDRCNTQPHLLFCL